MRSKKKVSVKSNSILKLGISFLVIILIIAVFYFLYSPASPAPVGKAVTVPECVNAPSGIVGWWTGDDNTNDQTGRNDANWNGPESYATGKLGKAFKLQNSYLTVEDDENDFNLMGTMSVELWFKVDAINQQYIPLIYKGKGTGNTERTYSLWLYSDTLTSIKSIHFAGGTKDVLPGRVTNNTVISAFSNDLNLASSFGWHHLVVTVSRPGNILPAVTTVTFYVDEANVGSREMSAIFSKDSSGEPLYIGGVSDTELERVPYKTFSGLIDDVTIYNKVLTPAEVTASYTAGNSRQTKCQIEKCNDEIDNDADGLIDCDDPDCSSFFKCQPEKAEITCDDGNDNDLDGKTDGDDPDCFASYSSVLIRNETGCLLANGLISGDGLVSGDSACRIAFPDGGRKCSSLQKWGVRWTDDDSKKCSQSCLDYTPANPLIRVVCVEADCRNGLDDDKDGTIDCNDNDCSEENTINYGDAASYEVKINADACPSSKINIQQS